jgi:hypothetical protein
MAGVSIADGHRMAVLYFFWGISLFGFVLWLPTIIKDAGSATS